MSCTRVHSCVFMVLVFGMKRWLRKIFLIKVEQKSSVFMLEKHLYVVASEAPTCHLRS